VKRFRLPKELLGGRVRPSTVSLSLLFVGVLALYLVVRPPPETGPSSQGASKARQEPTARTAPTETTPREDSGTATTPSRDSPSERTPTQTTPEGTGTQPDEGPPSPESGPSERGSPANPPGAPEDGGGNGGDGDRGTSTSP
jgi:cytoskeletal protein RodZ